MHNRLVYPVIKKHYINRGPKQFQQKDIKLQQQLQLSLKVHRSLLIEAYMQLQCLLD